MPATAGSRPGESGPPTGPTGMQDREEWAGLNSFVCVESVRAVNGQHSDERRYLHQRSGRPECPGHAGLRPRPLGHREQAALVAGRDLPRGHAAEPDRPLRRELLPHPPTGPEPAPTDKTCKVSLKGKRLRACLGKITCSRSSAREFRCDCPGCVLPTRQATLSASTPPNRIAPLSNAASPPETSGAHK